MFLIVVSLVTALVISAVVHEYAHYRAMRADGIRIVAAGLGLPFFPVLRIPFRGRTYTLSPWLVAAYVQPAKDDYQRMENETTYRNRAWHYGAGVWANFMLGFAATAVAVAADGRLIRAAVFAGVVGVLWLFRRPFTAYVQPALAPVVLGFFVYSMGKAWAAGHSGLGYAGLESAGATSLGVAELAGVLGAISLALAAINLLPFYPVDNGRVVGFLLDRWFGQRVTNAFQLTGAALVLLMLLGGVISDGWAIAS